MATYNLEMDSINETVSSIDDILDDPEYIMPAAKKPRIIKKKSQTRLEQFEKRINDKYGPKRKIATTNSSRKNLQKNLQKNVQKDQGPTGNPFPHCSDLISDDEFSAEQTHQTEPAKDVLVDISSDQTEFLFVTETTPINSPSNIQMNSDSVFDLIMDLKGQICELNNNVMLLRKQVSRVELKSVGWPIESNARQGVPNSSQWPGTKVDSDDLLDFESLMARDGLPVSTCIELSALESKLEKDKQYRLDLVRIFLILTYIPIRYICST